MSNTPKHKPLVLSGMQPTNTLHLGNYLGALKNWVKLQEQMPCLFCVVDMHAITQDVGGHQHRIGVETDAGALLVLAGFFLELGHAVQPAQPRHAIENPRQLGMFGHLALVEDRRTGGVHAARNISRCHFTRGLREFGGMAIADILGDGVHIHHAEQARHVVLHAHPILERAQIVAQVQRIRRLHAGKDELGVRSGHGCGS